MVSPTKLAVGQVVRYPEPPVPAPEYLDGYRNFFNLTALPGAPRIIMNRGIDHPAWVSASDRQRRPVILLRSNPLQAGSSKTPWHDVIDVEAGRVVYYGDHRASTTDPLGSTRGNEALLLTAEAHRSTSPQDRAEATPLLIFRSVERNNQHKGYLEFCGLGVIDSVTAIQQEDPKSHKLFPNYEFGISLLDLSTQDGQFDWSWINARRDPTLTSSETNHQAPTCWTNWINRVNDAEANKRRQESETPGESSESALRSPNWTWDEIVLACALTSDNEWKEVKKEDSRALELSDLLQQLSIHSQETRGDDFRSPSSVQRKTADIATIHPTYKGKATKGGQLTKDVVEAFLRRPREMMAAAEHIKAVLASGDPNVLEAVLTPPVEETDASADEGRTLERLHRYRERDPKLRRQKINATIASGKPLACEVCEFDFANVFGQHGVGYIEVHHIVPLHQIGPSKTKLKDLALLCANCHRMCHRRLQQTSTWPSPEELSKLIKSQS